MASGVRLKATQMTGRPITWAQLNLEAAEDLRGLMRRNRWAAELMLTLITEWSPAALVSLCVPARLCASCLAAQCRLLSVLSV